MASSERKGGGVPMLVFVGMPTVLSFVAITLSLFFVSRHYSRESVHDLEIKLRERLPLEVSELIDQKVGLVPRFMETALNLAEGTGIDLQTWEGHLKMRDVIAAYLRTFPGESRCCSAFLTIPKSSTGLVTPGPNNTFDIWNIVLLRPGGVDWWFNRTATGTALSVSTWDLPTSTVTETGILDQTDLQSTIQPWFSPDPTAIHPIYTPAVVWMLDEVQLKVHATLPLHHPTTKDWIGTYVAGFKLGFLSQSLEEKVASLPSWLLLLVDTSEVNNGVLLATSIHDYKVLSCFTAERCALETSDCRVCSAGETTETVLATNTTDARVRGVAQNLVKSVNGDWRFLMNETLSHTFSAGGQRQLVSTWGIRTNGLEWVGVAAVPHNEIFGKLEEGETIVTGVAVGLIVGGVLLLLFITISITRPLHLLSTRLWEVAHMELESDTDLAQYFLLAGVINEFSVCFSSFSVMVRQLKEYKSFIPQTVLLTSDEESDEQTSPRVSAGRRSQGRDSSTSQSFTTTTYSSLLGKGKQNHLAVGATSYGHFSVMSIARPVASESREKDAVEVTATTRQFVSAVLDACQATRGVAEFADGLNIMVTWGVAVKCSTSEQRACESASQLLREIPGVRVGIASGKGLIGTLGTEGMRKVAAVGSVYDVALKCREMNVHLGTQVVMDERTQRGSQYNYVLNPVEVVKEQGKRSLLYTLYAKKMGENQEWMYQVDTSRRDTKTANHWDVFCSTKPPYNDIISLTADDTAGDISLAKLVQLAATQDGSTYHASLQLVKGPSPSSSSAEVLMPA